MGYNSHLLGSYSPSSGGPPNIIPARRPRYGKPGCGGARQSHHDRRGVGGWGILSSSHPCVNAKIRKCLSPHVFRTCHHPIFQVLEFYQSASEFTITKSLKHYYNGNHHNHNHPQSKMAP